MRKVLCFGTLLAVAAVVAPLQSAEARPGGNRGGGGKPTFDRLLKAFDKNADGALAGTEVPGRMWDRLSRADANDDGFVTRQEFDALNAGA